ncbi:hypothetical protein IPM65_01785 [Candidatus Roizmanbacteria bacterium]|nr:MAG: hypothetical protein IPM65_01785 [Candidatus Roizmanbacteria bacterium]
MFSSIPDLFNRRNGDKSKSVDPNAIQVTIEETYSIPVAADREIVQTAVRETLEQVLPALLASQRRSPYDRSPFESPFRSRRSPFSSPFGDENDEDGTDALAAIMAMAMMALQSEENGERDCAYGEDDCMIGHAMRTLNLYVEDEEYRRWAEEDEGDEEDMLAEEAAEQAAD